MKKIWGTDSKMMRQQCKKTHDDDNNEQMIVIRKWGITEKSNECQLGESDLTR